MNNISETTNAATFEEDPDSGMYLLMKKMIALANLKKNKSSETKNLTTDELQKRSEIR